MICCCSLAGTAACKHCHNNPDAEPYEGRIYNTTKTKEFSLWDLLKDYTIPVKSDTFCLNCGAKISIADNFCRNCGAKNDGIMER